MDLICINLIDDDGSRLTYKRHRKVFLVFLFVIFMDEVKFMRTEYRFADFENFDPGRS